VQPIVLSKSLAASSSNALGFFSSQTVLYTSGVANAIGTSSGSVATSLDTARRIILWSSAATSDSLFITLTGVSSGGDPVVETIAGSTVAGVVRTTIQDFFQVTAVTFSSSLSVRMNFGTSSRAGTPWTVTDTWRNPFDMMVQLTLSSTLNSVYANFECTLEDITQETIPGPNKLSSAGAVVPWFPTPFISQITGSTYVSTAIDAVTTANFTAPISAWRVSMSSSAAGAATLGVTVLQSG
jgi:hypothetical protein